MTTKLTDYVGNHISRLCSNFTDDDQNMCAHFVSHVLNFSFGYNCRTHSGRQLSPAACIRVQEVFARCASVGFWRDRPRELDQCLIFVTTRSNPVDLQTKVFGNIPKKHVGILIADLVFHYSNNRAQVMKMDLPSFQTYMTTSYGEISIYYGAFPTGTGPVES